MKNDMVPWVRFLFTSVSSCSLVICGPSGVGKGSVISKLLERFPDKFALSVSHTSRKPRPGEIDGVHYHFIEKTLFEQIIKNSPEKFLEFAYVHNNLYGTSYDAIRKINDEGKVCLFDVDCNGVRSFKKANFYAKYVFLRPPSIEELERRIRKRGAETEEQIRIRLNNAKSDMEFGTKENFDLILVNDQLDRTVADLSQWLQTWKA